MKNNNNNNNYGVRVYAPELAEKLQNAGFELLKTEEIAPKVIMYDFIVKSYMQENEAAMNLLMHMVHDKIELSELTQAPTIPVTANIINLTPHAINIITDSQTITMPASGNTARVQQKTEVVGNITGIPITVNTFGTVEGLPEEQEGTYYIVSNLVMSALPNRKDLLFPSEPVRDAEGKIIGCKSLGRM